MPQPAAKFDVKGDFLHAKGTHYLELLGAMHHRLVPDWYLEIGTNTGASLAKSRCKSVAVDPEFKLRKNPVEGVPQAHLFQMPSDDFFETGFLATNNIRVDLAFLDGMHLFEYLLRDFMNTEAHSNPTATITLHDCCPFNSRIATRNRETNAWTGDVWKALVILLQERPDLDIKVYDAAPTGLVAIRNLDPGNTVLAHRFDDLVAQFTDLSLSDFGGKRFYDMFTFESTDAYVQSIFAV